MPLLSPQDILAIQQQNAARRAGIAQQSQAQQQDMAMQQYANQLAQWQWAQQQGQYQQDRTDRQRQQDRADKLSQEYQTKLDQANQKNESRYLDILAGRTDTRNRVLGDLKTFGQSQISDANDRYKSLNSQMQADIYSRGFGGSPSMLNSANRSSENARDRELNRINDDIINRRVAADASQSEGIAGFMERRNDVPPDLNQLIQLQQGLGRSGSYLPQPSSGGFGSPPPQYGTQPYSPGYGSQPSPGGSRYGTLPYNPGYGSQPPGPPNQYYANSGAFSQESLPGAGSGMAMQQPSAAMANGPFSENARVAQARSQWEQQQRNSQVALKGAMDSRAATSTGTGSLENDIQRQAIGAGYANWSPGQQMPLIPGMAGGPMGAGQLLPSLPYGYGDGGRRGYGSGGGNYGFNYQKRMSYRRPTMQGYGNDYQQLGPGPTMAPPPTLRPPMPGFSMDQGGFQLY